MSKSSQTSLSGLEKVYYDYATEKHLTTLLDIDYKEYEVSDVLIFIEAPTNLKALSSVDPAKLVKRSKTM